MTALFYNAELSIPRVLRLESRGSGIEGFLTGRANPAYITLSNPIIGLVTQPYIS